MVRGFGPRAVDLSLDGRVLVHHQNRIGGQQIEKVGTGWGGRVRYGTGLGADWKNRYPLDRVAGALRIEIETAYRHDLIAPPLDACRRRHSKTVDVENAAAYGVLRNFCDRRYALVTHRAQSLDRGGEASFLFRPLEDETGVLQCRRHRGSRRTRSRRRDEHADVS